MQTEESSAQFCLRLFKLNSSKLLMKLMVLQWQGVKKKRIKLRDYFFNVSKGNFKHKCNEEVIMVPSKTLGKLFCRKGINVKSIQILELDGGLESADSTQNTMISATSLR